MRNATETETTTPTAEVVPPSPELLLGRFDRVEIRTASEARATLRDGSLFVRVSATAEIAYTVRRFVEHGEHVLLVRALIADQWRQLDPAWQLPATIIYTPQNNEE